MSSRGHARRPAVDARIRGGICRERVGALAAHLALAADAARGGHEAAAARIIAVRQRPVDIRLVLGKGARADGCVRALAHARVANVSFGHRDTVRVRRAGLVVVRGLDDLGVGVDRRRLPRPVPAPRVRTGGAASCSGRAHDGHGHQADCESETSHSGQLSRLRAPGSWSFPRRKPRSALCRSVPTLIGAPGPPRRFRWKAAAVGAKGDASDAVELGIQ
jgi:hypothetical protein